MAGVERGGVLASEPVGGSYIVVIIVHISTLWWDVPAHLFYKVPGTLKHIWESWWVLLPPFIDLRWPGGYICGRGWPINLIQYCLFFYRSPEWHYRRMEQVVLLLWFGNDSRFTNCSSWAFSCSTWTEETGN